MKTIRKDWLCIKLGDACKKANKIKKNEQKQDLSFIYIDIGSIDNKTNKILSYKTYKWKEAPSRAQQIIEYQDILFSTVRTYLKNIAFVDNTIFHGQICSSGFTVIAYFGQNGHRFRF